MAIFQTSDINIYYEVKGKKDSVHCIAFLNGVMASASSWALLTPLFINMGWRVILHDFRGQLNSDKPEGPYTFKDHVEDAKALFEHLGVNKVHLVGTSYGGEVAMKFAIEYPEMVKSITVIDSVSELDTNLKDLVKTWKELCDSGDGETFFWGMAPAIYSSKFLNDNHDLLAHRAQAIKDNPGEYLEGQKILYDTFHDDVYMTDQLDRIKCPALIVCGENDTLKPPKFSKIIADNIAKSEYIIIPDCGHVVIFEKPKVLESALVGFILKNEFP